MEDVFLLHSQFLQNLLELRISKTWINCHFCLELINRLKRVNKGGGRCRSWFLCLGVLVVFFFWFFFKCPCFLIYGPHIAEIALCYSTFSPPEQCNKSNSLCLLLWRQNQRSYTTSPRSCMSGCGLSQTFVREVLLPGRGVPSELLFQVVFIPK